jgi:ABC-type transport system involved in cytochrome c biogenesis ATPase subunit
VEDVGMRWIQRITVIVGLAAAIADKREGGGIVIAATHLDFPGSQARTLTLRAAA